MSIKATGVQFSEELTILIVDDDESGPLQIRRILRDVNPSTNVLDAVDGLEALTLLRDKTVHRGRMLVLLDLHMPRMDGLSFLKQVRQDPQLRRLPVVVLTSSDTLQDKAEAYRLGISGYFRKPVTFAGLAQLIQTLASYWEAADLPPPGVARPHKSASIVP